MNDRLQAELAQTRLELQQLKERMETGAVTVHKDLSLVSLIPKWSGSDSTISLEEFFSGIESSVKIANWKQTDQLQIAILKLSGGADTFYQGCVELHTKETNWQTFKEAFRSRYKDVHTDQYHFTRLQTARQKKNESPPGVCRQVSWISTENYAQSRWPCSSARALWKCRANATSKLRFWTKWIYWKADELCISQFNASSSTDCFGSRTSRETGQI